VSLLENLYKLIKRTGEMVPDCLITRVRSVAPATKDGDGVVATALDLTGLYNSRDSTGSDEGLRGRRFQATPRQPGLNSHLNASEVALTAITADGRLLTHALPAKAEPPTNPPASLDEVSLSPSLSLSLSLFASRFLPSPYLLSSHLLAVFAPTSDLPFIVAISRKCRESLKRCPTFSLMCYAIANFVAVIILTDENTLNVFNSLY